MNELLEISKHKLIDVSLAMPPKSNELFLIRASATIDSPDKLIIDTKFNHDHKISMEVDFYILQRGISYDEDCKYSLDNALDVVVMEVCSTECDITHTDREKRVLYFRENRASFLYSFRHIVEWIKIKDLYKD